MLAQKRTQQVDRKSEEGCVGYADIASADPPQERGQTIRLVRDKHSLVFRDGAVRWR